MVATYVLHGGGTSKDSADNDEFFKRFTSIVHKNEIKILMCYFARPLEKWEELLKRDEAKIRKNTDKKVELIVTKDAGDLLNKLKISDVLYVAGGEQEHLAPYYSKLSELEMALSGKVYIGSSMGAFMVSRNYVLSLSRQEENKVFKGIDILPISTLCHWNVEKKKAYKIQILKDADNQAPIVTLDEGKFAVFVK